MLDAFFATLAVALEFLGAGLLIDLLPIPKTSSAPGAMVRGALALALLAAALNLLVPLDGWVTRPLWLVAALTTAVRWRRLRAWLGARWGLSLVAWLALVALASASAAVRGPEYDTGLYHLQTLLWQATSAAPAGLANLHHRLAYNSAWHLLAGVVDAGAEPFALAFAVNAALTAAVLWGLGQWALSALAAPRAFAVSALLWLALPGIALLSYEAGSPATDLPAMLLVLWSLGQGLAAAGADGEHRAAWTTEALLGAAFATLVKLSSAPLLLLPAVLVWRAWRAGQRAPVRAAIGLGLAAVPWGLRGVLESGCVGFPLPLACLEGLPWTVAPGTALDETRVIRDWARTPTHRGAHTEGWSWLADWWRYQSHNLLLVGMLAVGLLGALLLLLGWFWHRDGGRAARLAPLAWPLAVAVVGCGSWFLGAPDPRFALGFLGGAAALLLAMGGLAVAGPGDWPKTRWGLAGLVASALTWHGVVVTRQAIARPPTFPATDHDAPLRTIALTGGGTVSAPLPGADLCWAAPPPCTPYPDPALRLVPRFGRVGFERPPP